MNTSDSPTNGRPDRVVVAMSGGVDSSVAAALLVEQGYDVTGVMLRLWSEPGRGSRAPANRCCTPDQIADARRVADRLDIPFYVVDVQAYFYQQVVQFFIDEHARARTPNPCLACNREIRFSFLLERALALGASHLATGHYARVRRTGAASELLRAVDEQKDQSYVLHVLGQYELARVLFPVGELRKREVRRLAEARGLLPVADKAESMDLCFLGDGDYRRFLREHAPEGARPGPILDRSGQTLGWHDGLPDYTIGQRKGLGVVGPEPLYVIAKDIARNALIVGTRDEAAETELVVRDVHWVAGAPPALPYPTKVRVRYKARPVAATLLAERMGQLAVRLEAPVAGITPGQGAVFYDGEVCLGGGLIADRETGPTGPALKTLVMERA